jgi:hypothetical protein
MDFTGNGAAGAERPDMWHITAFLASVTTKRRQGGAGSSDRITIAEIEKRNG